MKGISVITRCFRHEVSELFAHAKQEVVVCAPYISMDGVRTLRESCVSAARIGSASLVITDLSTHSACTGSTDPKAVVKLRQSLPGSKLVHLARLHAKVYIADDRTAIVSSANLTAGGLGLNYECGIRVRDRAQVRAVAQAVREYAKRGTEMGDDALAVYCAAALEARRLFQRQLTAARRAAKGPLQEAVERSETALLRAALGDGKPHPVFARAIRLLLRRHGPMTTVQLYPFIQAMHPNLCDDRVDRIIRGRSFGHKWWHAVRTAQQQLKKKGIIVRTGELWSLCA